MSCEGHLVLSRLVIAELDAYRRNEGKAFDQLPPELLIEKLESELKGHRESFQFIFGNYRMFLPEREEIRQSGVKNFGTQWATRAEKLLQESRSLDSLNEVDQKLLKLYFQFLCMEFKRAAFEKGSTRMLLHIETVRLRIAYLAFSPPTDPEMLIAQRAKVDEVYAEFRKDLEAFYDAQRTLRRHSNRFPELIGWMQAEVKDLLNVVPEDMSAFLQSQADDGIDVSNVMESDLNPETAPASGSGVVIALPTVPKPPAVLNKPKTVVR
jgi:hypothetical protein